MNTSYRIKPRRNLRTKTTNSVRPFHLLGRNKSVQTSTFPLYVRAFPQAEGTIAVGDEYPDTTPAVIPTLLPRSFNFLRSVSTAPCEFAAPRGSRTAREGGVHGGTMELASPHNGRSVGG